jgi:2-iminobutanoate/2-iminopropanoate deaminase
MKRGILIATLLLLGNVWLQAQSSDAPKPIAPYSPYVWAGNTLYLAGQIPIVPGTGKLVEGDIQEQTRQVMKNIGNILRSNGMSFSNLVKCTIYMTNLDNYGPVNEAYAEFFEGDFPARVAVQVVRLPMDAEIEISSIAVKTKLTTKRQK